MSVPISRRVFLARAAGMTLTLGAGGISSRMLGAGRRYPYAQGIWLAGDHHIHTKYSPDGEYEIERQVANAELFGLNWCAITDHGGPHHDRVALNLAYPDLVRARQKHPGLIVFQGMEWNIPSAEHGSVILPPTADEAAQIANFEASFDEKNLAREAPHTAEADAVAGVRFLQSLTPKPLFFANHPARRGLDSPHEMRAWSDAGPDVARGFEGAPGHAACTLAGHLRGEYDKAAGAGSFAGFPPDSYRTWGGYDWFTAKVGGVWDSLLGEGRPWYITANSDSHRHFDDHVEIDTSTYATKGYVTTTGRQAAEGTDFDFYPGEYTKTWVFAARRDPMAVLDGLRSGNMFTVLGGLIDRLDFSARSSFEAAPMGSTLVVSRPGDDVTVTIQVHTPDSPNGTGRIPSLHHVDVIAGDILGPERDGDTLTNPTTRVVAQMRASDARRWGDSLIFRWRFSNVRKSFYVRVRGTNTDVQAPRLDSPTVNPWDDLWFYSNPIFVRAG